MAPDRGTRLELAAGGAATTVDGRVGGIRHTGVVVEIAEFVLLSRRAAIQREHYVNTHVISLHAVREMVQHLSIFSPFTGCLPL